MRALFLFLLLPVLGFSFTLKNIICSADKGDYVAVEQDKNYTLLLVKENTDAYLVLEEMSIPTKQMKEKSFKKWLHKKAPGSTSWTCFLLDKEKNELVAGFSYLRNERISLAGEMSIFSKLLDLDLTALPDRHRKKIGAPPIGEHDHRSLWKPDSKINGSKSSRTKYQVYRTKWADDKSELSNKTIDLYFTKKPTIALPLCALVHGDHLRVMLRAVDAGKGLNSPQKMCFNLSEKSKENSTVEIQ